MISFHCACGEPLAAADEHAGMRVKCPKCDSVLVVPEPESEFEYADDPAPPPPPKKKGPVLVDEDDPPRRSSAPPPPPKRKPKLVDEDEENDRPKKKKAALVEDDEDDRPKKKKKKKRNYGDDDEPEHVKRLMAKANADLDEEEARHAREGGGVHFTPGIIGGLLAFVIGSLGAIVVICVFPNIFLICFCGAIALGGLIRCVLSFLGQGVD